MTSTLLEPAARDVVGAGPAQTPYLELDIADAVDRYARLRDAFGHAAVHYAVKANPHPALLRALVRAGGRFDVAGAGELELCLAAGAAPRDPRRWEPPVAAAARVFAAARGRGLAPRLLDLGGGLPARHAGECPPLARYVDTITAAVRRHFGSDRPELLVEPGRGVVGDAGRLVAEVMVFEAAGAYTTALSTVGFNGFPALPTVLR